MKSYCFGVLLSVLCSACGAQAVGPLDGAQPDVVSRDALRTDVVITPDVSGGCPGGQTSCSGICRDTRTDPNACGACGIACSDGGRCVGGRCMPGGCPPGQSVCGVRCFDLQNDPRNCGACGVACRDGAACVAGRCSGVACAGTLIPCGDVCVDPLSDPANCGACERRCSPGERCVMGGCFRDAMPPPIGGPEFRIDALTALRCQVVEHEMPTGDDRGGIALGGRSLYYTGDRATGQFDVADLRPARSIAPMYDGLTGNLGSRDSGSSIAYVLGQFGMPLNTRSPVVTDLLRLDAMGSITGAPTVLSSPISLVTGSMTASVGIFAGRDRVVLLDGERAFHIALPSGLVTDMGAMTTPPHSPCESFAFWGTAEFFGGELWVDYVRDVTTIVRTRVPDGLTEVIAGFANLSDMCSFTVDPEAGRWYFHHEFESQFRSGNETIGHCRATFTAP